MLVLTTKGRKTGTARSSVLLYMPDGADYIVVGSNGGRPEAPAWLLNLQANPDVEVRVARERFRARAVVLTGAERDAIWPRLAQHYKGWDHYRTLTDRPIHPVRLVRSHP
jgi:deazaflavin-dependent oxidoreductase (nitroreductase family)